MSSYMTKGQSQRRRSERLLAVAFLAAGFTLGCAQPENEKVPQVTTQGPHAVALGGSIQIVPATTNGKDRSYTFATASAAIAKVDDLGLVTGVSLGETNVVVTGQDTKATASHPVVVVPAGTITDGGVTDGSADAGATQVPAGEVPFYQAWLGSAHADRTAEAFVHWNQEGMVPQNCARCHSSEGFVDYLGGDNTVPGTVDRPAPTESVVRCATCHTPAAETLTTVTFPSGAKIEGLGRRGHLHDLPPGAGLRRATWTR